MSLRQHILYAHISACLNRYSVVVFTFLWQHEPPCPSALTPTEVVFSFPALHHARSAALQQRGMVEARERGLTYGIFSLKAAPSSFFLFLFLSLSLCITFPLSILTHFALRREPACLMNPRCASTITDGKFMHMKARTNVLKGRHWIAIKWLNQWRTTYCTIQNSVIGFKGITLCNI